MKEIVYSDKAPSPVGPYSQAIKHGDVLYVSGQIAIDQSTGVIIDSTIEEETHQVMKNLGYILEAAGLSYKDVIKCSVFVTDMKLYTRINEVYGSYFDDDTAPVRELVEVANLPKYINIEISCIADIS